MSQTGTGTGSRRRGTRHDQRTKRGEPTVTLSLNNPEFIDKVKCEYVNNTMHARVCKDNGQRAFTDAADLASEADGLGAQEQEAVASLQQAESKLRQIQARRQEITNRAEQARTYGAGQMASLKGFESAAADAKAVLVSARIPLPEVDEPSLQASQQPPSVNGAAPVPDLTRPDPTAAAIDGSLASIDAARAELPEKHQDRGEL